MSALKTVLGCLEFLQLRLDFLGPHQSKIWHAETRQNRSHFCRKAQLAKQFLFGRDPVVSCRLDSIERQENHFTCPAFGGGELPIFWQIEYTAYIPFDHVTGPTTCSGAH